ncbi:MAG: DnaJ domain-containing protein [Deltaproteobacteria bacterium]|nr:DnaJ domain-containing protein [Deltaproteobacteria bacterium]
MYIAFKNINKKVCYFLRESFFLNDELDFRDLFDLGSDPSDFIIYPGGNAFYIDEIVENSLEKAGASFEYDVLEDLFWPWVRPDIKRAVETFRNRSSSQTRTGINLEINDKARACIKKSVNNLDKRRMHFLKFGNMDQGPVENMPEVLFKNLMGKSRDEMEQYLMAKEFVLNVQELKSYVYTIFNLQEFFQGFMAKKMPHVLDQERVDEYFIQQLCSINREVFHKDQSLHEYLQRYAYMFFDYEYAHTTLLEELYNDFRFRHRFYKSPEPKTFFHKSRALKIFNLTSQELKTMDKSSLARVYRKLAYEHHPDKGGSKEKFIEINNAYQSLLQML